MADEIYHMICVSCAKSQPWLVTGDSDIAELAAAAGWAEWSAPDGENTGSDFQCPVCQKEKV